MIDNTLRSFKSYGLSFQTIITKSESFIKEKKMIIVMQIVVFMTEFDNKNKIFYKEFPIVLCEYGHMLHITLSNFK